MPRPIAREYFAGVQSEDGAIFTHVTTNKRDAIRWVRRVVTVAAPNAAGFVKANGSLIYQCHTDEQSRMRVDEL